jgi:hypothetical protein
MDPVLTLAPHEEMDMHARNEVDEPGDDLEGQVEGSVALFGSAGGAITDEAAEETYEHDDEAKQHINAQTVVQPRNVGADEGGREHDELSQPLDDVEGSSEANERLVHSRGFLLRQGFTALSQSTDVRELVDAVNGEEKVDRIDYTCNSTERSPSLLNKDVEHLRIEVVRKLVQLGVLKFFFLVRLGIFAVVLLEGRIYRIFVHFAA